MVSGGDRSSVAFALRCIGLRLFVCIIARGQLVEFLLGLADNTTQVPPGSFQCCLTLYTVNVLMS